jgi:hypothetical protein
MPCKRVRSCLGSTSSAIANGLVNASQLVLVNHTMYKVRSRDKHNFSFSFAPDLVLALRSWN